MFRQSNVDRMIFRESDIYGVWCLWSLMFKESDI